MEKGNRKDKLLPPLARIFRENRGFNRWTVLIVTAGVLHAALNVAMAWVFKDFVDRTIARDFATFMQSLGLLLVVLICGLLSDALGRYSTGRYSAMGMRNLRRKLGGKFASLTMSEMERRRTGDMLSLLGNDLGQLNGFIEEQMRWIISDAVGFALALAFMIYLNPWLTLATVAYVPIGAALSMLASKPVQRLTEEQNARLGAASAIAQDAVSGHSEVKAFAMGPWMYGKYAGALAGWVKAGLRVSSAQVPAGIAAMINLAIPFTLLLVVGLYFVFVKGTMTAGALLAFIQVTNNVINPLMSFTWRLSEMRRAAGAAGRVIEALDAPSEREDGRELALEEGAPLLSFRDVRFSYPRDNGDGTTTQQVVFNGLSLDIRRGETVAVVGASGCGKSTLLKLAAGFYPSESGEVRFGGHPIGQWSLRSLRSHYALVDQDTYLFPGSIGENVACGAMGDRGKPTEDAVREALRMAQLDDFVDSLPEGAATSVGERGSKLSGGQRQRVAIARGALRNADIVLLDEPTSALDVTTEREIQRELSALMRGRTALIVTHRLSMALYADRIVVLEGGVVAEQGTHEELLERRGAYYALYEKQISTTGGEAA